LQPEQLITRTVPGAEAGTSAATNMQAESKHYCVGMTRPGVGLFRHHQNSMDLELGQGRQQAAVFLLAICIQS
jgi:hypothetical protein